MLQSVFCLFCIIIREGLEIEAKSHKIDIVKYENIQVLTFEGLLIHMVVTIHIHDKWCIYTDAYVL